jgi:hypothetical protein
MYLCLFYIRVVHAQNLASEYKLTQHLCISLYFMLLIFIFLHQHCKATK